MKENDFGEILWSHKSDKKNSAQIEDATMMKFSRNKRKRQPIGMLGSKQWQPWLAACQRKRLRSCGFRLRNARNAHATQAIAFE